ncbi:MAG: aspartyl protease family protein [Sphingomicrobium sp.]
MRRLVVLACLAAIADPAAADVPIKIAATGHATVPVTGPFGTEYFVFDTGAGGSAVYADFQKAKQFPAGAGDSLTGQTGSSDLPTVILPPVTLDGRRAEALEAVVFPPRVDGVRLPGVIGLDLFGTMTVDFDLPQRRLALLDSKTLPPGVTGRPVDVETTTGDLLAMKLTIAGVAALAVIDTGARKTRINWKLGRLLGLSPKNLVAGDVIQGATNNPIASYSGSVNNVRLGDRLLAKAPVLVADLPVFEVFGVADKPAVILGLDWLEETRLVLDVPQSKAWFMAAVR